MHKRNIYAAIVASLTLFLATESRAETVAGKVIAIADGYTTYDHRPRFCEENAQNRRENPMNRYLGLLALTWLACVAMPAHAGENHAALVKSMTGDVQVARQHETFEATSGTTLL